MHTTGITLITAKLSQKYLFLHNSDYYLVILQSTILVFTLLQLLALPLVPVAQSTTRRQSLPKNEWLFQKLKQLNVTDENKPGQFTLDS